MAVEADVTMANKIKDACQRMANEYEKYTEAFEEWSKEEGHGLDKKEMSDLHDNMRRLIEERDRAWNEKREMLRKETNYGLMKLRHNTTQNHLKEMSSWLEGYESKKSATQDKTNRTPAPTPELEEKN